MRTICLLAVLIALNAAAADLLTPLYPPARLASVLLERDDWRPYPRIDEANGWDHLPEAVRMAYIRAAEKELENGWNPLPASVFLDYVRNGNRSRYQALAFGRRDRLAHLVLAELFERQGRFVDPILDGIWAICEESYWGVPAHLGLQKAGHGLPDVDEPTVDLFAAETGALLAWSAYLLGPALDNLDSLILLRILSETDRRILTPFEQREDWSWMGFRYRRDPENQRRVNNWNPWINSNVLTCALLLERNEERRRALVHKAMASLDNFLSPYPADGGCDEGPSYWGRAGGSLYDALELLHSASNGAIDLFDAPLIKAMGRYIYRAYIRYPYFINFADAPARLNPDPVLIHAYGSAIGDTVMTGFAAFCAAQRDQSAESLAGRIGSLGRHLRMLTTRSVLLKTAPREPLLADSWWPAIEVMAARSQSGSADGLYLAAKGGHNDESHNHNDVGNFIVYLNGRPVLIDAGSQTYTAKTFSSRRYELWNNQSAYHNLPTINGVMQRQGGEFSAGRIQYENGDRHAQLRLDIAGAYPPEAAVKSWTRTIRLNRGRNVEVIEQMKLERWISPPELNLVTPLSPSTAAAGEIVLSDGETKALLNYQPDRFAVELDTLDLDDGRMRDSWGRRLYRIVLRAQKRRLEDRYVLTVSGFK